MRRKLKWPCKRHGAEGLARNALGHQRAQPGHDGHVVGAETKAEAGGGRRLHLELSGRQEREGGCLADEDFAWAGDFAAGIRRAGLTFSRRRRSAVFSRAILSAARRRLIACELRCCCCFEYRSL